MNLKNHLMQNLKLIITLLLLGITYNSDAHKLDSLKKNQHFELSFGNSLIFISNSKQINIHKQSALVIPTSSLLFFAEFRPQKKLRIPLFINIATESKQFLVNGQLINEKASPTFGSGISFKLFQIKLDSTSKIELEGGPLASFIFDDKNNFRVAPVVACRLRIMRGTNFVMYCGVSYSIGINAFGLVYGTGTIF